VEAQGLGASEKKKPVRTLSIFKSMAFVKDAKGIYNIYLKTVDYWKYYYYLPLHQVR
jgi:hypothetical protein